MWSTFFSAFAIVFVAELPDKTALASLVLATRFRPRDVIAGAWLAFLVQTVVATAAGSVLHLFPERPIHVAAGIGFLVFAGLALRRDAADELIEEEESTARAERRRRLPPVVVSFLVVFAAEWGDLTQLATAALVARVHNPLPVVAGAIAALWLVTVIAAIAGAQAGRFLDATLLNRAAASLFAVVGLVILVRAFL